MSRLFTSPKKLFGKKDLRRKLREGLRSGAIKGISLDAEDDVDSSSTTEEPTESSFSQDSCSSLYSSCSRNGCPSHPSPKVSFAEKVKVRKIPARKYMTAAEKKYESFWSRDELNRIQQDAAILVRNFAYKAFGNETSDDLLVGLEKQLPQAKMERNERRFAALGDVLNAQEDLMRRFQEDSQAKFTSPADEIIRSVYIFYTIESETKAREEAMLHHQECCAESRGWLKSYGAEERPQNSLQPQKNVKVACSA
jgi:hypothetical protein